MQDLGPLQLMPPPPLPAPPAPPAPPVPLALPVPGATSEAPSALTPVVTPAPAEGATEELEALVNQVSATLEQLLSLEGSAEPIEPNPNENQNRTHTMRQTTLEELPAVVMTPRNTSNVEDPSGPTVRVSGVHPLWAAEIENHLNSPATPTFVTKQPALENPEFGDSHRDVKDYMGFVML